jgi:hypothetical protein
MMGKKGTGKEITDDEKGHSRCSDAWVLLHDEQTKTAEG